MSIASSIQKMPIDAYQEIFEKFVDDASFLWILRSIAVEQPHYSSADIRQLEQRIDAQLDGLMTSIEQSWPICLEAITTGEPGEVFVTTILAFRSHDVKKIQIAVEAAMVNDQAEKGFISALGWLPAQLVNSWIEKLLGSKDLNHKYLAVAGCSVRRGNPGEVLSRILQREDCQQHDKLYARSLRLAGEIRRQDLMPLLEQAVQSENENVVFWANWSSVLLGNRANLEHLKSYALKPGEYQYRAMDIAFRAMPVERAREWIAELSENNQQQRAVIKAVSILSDPHAVNWLISLMEEPELSRVAAEAFTQITGFDLIQNQLTTDPPEAMSQHPNDEADNEDVSLDDDENLPWPDIQKVKSFWINHGKSFISGQRYFMGSNITLENLKEKLVSANQRQRHTAALELALIDSDVPLQNTRAKLGGG